MQPLCSLPLRCTTEIGHTRSPLSTRDANVLITESIGMRCCLSVVLVGVHVICLRQPICLDASILNNFTFATLILVHMLAVPRLHDDGVDGRTLSSDRFLQLSLYARVSEVIPVIQSILPL